MLAKLKMNEGLSPQDIKQNEGYFTTAHGEADLFVDDLGTFAAIDRLVGLAKTASHLREVRR
jgi:hypothetical protein